MRFLHSAIVFIIMISYVSAQDRFLVLPNPEKCKARFKEFQYDGRNYFYSGHDKELKDTKLDWLDARNKCRERCMETVSFETQAEFDFMKEYMEKNEIKFIWTSGRLCDFAGCEGRWDLLPKIIKGWLWSANQIQIDDTNKTPKGWTYTPWSYTGHFKRKQPDNAEFFLNQATESCLGVLNNQYNDSIAWHDIACYHRTGFICEDSAELLSEAQEIKSGSDQHVDVMNPPQRVETTEKPTTIAKSTTEKIKTTSKAIPTTRTIPKTTSETIKTTQTKETIAERKKITTELRTTTSKEIEAFTTASPVKLSRSRRTRPTNLLTTTEIPEISSSTVQEETTKLLRKAVAINKSEEEISVKYLDATPEIEVTTEEIISEKIETTQISLTEESSTTEKEKSKKFVPKRKKIYKLKKRTTTTREPITISTSARSLSVSDESLEKSSEEIDELENYQKIDETTTPRAITSTEEPTEPTRAIPIRRKNVKLYKKVIKFQESIDDPSQSIEKKKRITTSEAPPISIRRNFYKPKFHSRLIQRLKIQDQ